MEPHPVPQNVTSFEFRLVGDMTIKQFSYLASGLSIAYLTFVLIFPISSIVAVPIIILSSALGAAFAFLPILDRPLDHWVKAYFKAIMRPTKASWKPSQNLKVSVTPKDPAFKTRLPLYLNQALGEPLPLPNIPVPANRIQPVIRPIPSSLQPQPTPKPPTPPEQHAENRARDEAQLRTSLSSLPPGQQFLPSAKELNTLVEMAREAQLMQVKIIELEKQVNMLKTTPTAPHPDVLPMPMTSPLPTPVVPKLENPQVKAPVVKVVETVTPKKTQIVLTYLPNVINGTVANTDGAYLEGVIVIIHNKDNLPVRALKTNKLGQFSGATPLPDGLYTITLEKEGLEFDTLQITLDGKILGPLIIGPKKGATAHA